MMQFWIKLQRSSLMKLFFYYILFAALTNVAFAQQHKHTHKHLQHTHHHKTKKISKMHKKHPAHHARVYKPQYSASNDKQLNLNIAQPADTTQSTWGGFIRRGLVASVEDRMVKFVHKTVSNLRYSVYKLGGGHFEPARGVYVLDCSDYVDNVLQAVDPKAYSGLVNYMGTDRPTSQHYYDFFTELDSDNSQHGWTRIKDVDQLLPGDVLVFRYKRGMHATGGHVMIVMDKPISDDNVYLVRVADSAPSGHSQDTRQPNTSGIGIGTLLLKADPASGRPSAYAWKVGAPFKNNVRIAMGRPIYS
jgi:cell wall-associated NlpC family hydrolase